MIIFSIEIENSTEVEPFHRNSPVKKKNKKDSCNNASVEEASLKNVHIIITCKFLKAYV